jgi:ferritin
MINEKMQEALNSQVNAELYSAYLYLAMEAWLSAQGFGGMANWMRCQTQEEVMHAMKIYDFIIERGGTVKLDAIEKPPATWNSAQDVFEASYAHEQKVTGLINDLMDLAIEQKDHAAASFLRWFVDEQVEEESSVDEVVQKLKMVDKTPGGMFMVDKELAQRVFTPPTQQPEE